MDGADRIDGDYRPAPRANLLPLAGHSRGSCAIEGPTALANNDRPCQGAGGQPSQGCDAMRCLDVDEWIRVVAKRRRRRRGIQRV